MPTIIDVFAVELGLDPTKFKQGVVSAIEDLRKLKEQSEKNAKEAEENAKKSTDAFASMTRQIKELAAAYLTFTAIKGFIRDIVEQNTALNNQAAALGISIERLSAMNNMARMVGSSAQGMTSALAGVQQQLTAMNFFHLPPSPQFLQGASLLGLQSSAFLGPNVTPDSFILAAAQAARRQLDAGRPEAAVSQMLQRLGITDTGLIAAMMQRDPNELRKFLEETKKMAPTQDAIDATKKFNVEFGRMLGLFDKMAGDMGKLLPVLDPLMKFFEGLFTVIDKLINIIPGGFWSLLGEIMQPGGIVGGIVRRGYNRFFGGGEEGAGPGGSSSQNAAPAHRNSYLEQARASRIAEINNDPQLKENVLKMLQLEEGSVGGKTGAMEALLNRSIMTGNTIREELFSGFYGPINRGGLNMSLTGSARASSEAAFNAAAGGSNTILGRTDQGMAGDPNAGGPGRVHVPGTSGIFNFWQGTRRGHFFSHEDSQHFAEEQNRRANAVAQGSSPDRVSSWMSMFQHLFGTESAEAGTGKSDGPPSKKPWYQEYWDRLMGRSNAKNEKHSMLYPMEHPALFHNQSVNNSNVSTAETHIGTVAFYTQATDPRGLANEIMPMLSNRRIMMAANNIAGGPV